VESAKQWGIEMPITLAGRMTNKDQPADIAAIAKIWAARLPGFSAKPVISLLGLAFKGAPPTDDLRGTMALPIYNELKAVFPGAFFRGFDPVVARGVTEEFFGFPSAASLPAAFEGADLVMMLNNHTAFQQMDIAALAASMRRPGIVYDLWNMHDDVAASMPEGVMALALGSEQA
jgi:UDP-N-acetyl-D-mannosaminuronic acid dehydrogenase